MRAAKVTSSQAAAPQMNCFRSMRGPSGFMAIPVTPGTVNRDNS